MKVKQAVVAIIGALLLTVGVLGDTAATHKPNHPPKATATPTVTPPPQTGFVGRQGTSLRLNGGAYVFTGLNIYNANSRNDCWYSLGFNDGALATQLTDIGSGKEAFRAWFFQGLATTNGQRDWAAFDHTLAVARAAGQKVIVVLTGEGGCGDNALHPASWYESGYRTLVQTDHTVPYRDYAREVVTRYRDDPTVLMWQIGNELEIKVDPNTCGSAATMEAFVEDMAAVIKSVDSNHLVNPGTVGTGQCGAQGSAQYRALHDSANVDLCELHDYMPGAMPGDQYNGLAMRIADCAALGKPLFVGEAGIDRTVGLDVRASQFSDKVDAQLAAGVVGFVAWDWRAAGRTDGDPYVIGPSDPTLSVLAR